MSIIYSNFVGIDIGKFEIVLNIHGSKQVFSYQNTTEGLSKLYLELEKELKDSLVVLEVTGGYERLTINYLQEQNIAVHRANGRQIKSFIRSYGIVGKTDKIDAIAISLYASERHKTLDLYQKNDHELLRELNERRADLVKIRVQEKNRAQAPTNIRFHQSFAAILEVLNVQISSIEEQIAQIIDSNPHLKAKLKVLKTIPGVGEFTANAIISYMPELGSLNQKQVASLAGVAPHPQQSGTKQKRGRTIGGRRQMRPILFISAMAASRTKTKLGDFYKALLANGKTKMCALVAVMRKIIVIANARIKQQLALAV